MSQLQKLLQTYFGAMRHDIFCSSSESTTIQANKLSKNIGYRAYFCSKTVREMAATFLNARLTCKSVRSCSYASFYGDLYQAFEDNLVLLEEKVQKLRTPGTMRCIDISCSLFPVEHHTRLVVNEDLARRRCLVRLRKYCVIFFCAN